MFTKQNAFKMHEYIYLINFPQLTNVYFKNVPFEFAFNLLIFKLLDKMLYSYQCLYLLILI
jgi:hypothetical protein